MPFMRMIVRTKSNVILISGANNLEAMKGWAIFI
jgi:hypothetical protein